VPVPVLAGHCLAFDVHSLPRAGIWGRWSRGSSSTTESAGGTGSADGFGVCVNAVGSPGPVTVGCSDASF